jgi:hypothetical protein
LTSATARSDLFSFFMTLVFMTGWNPDALRRARVHCFLYFYAFGAVDVTGTGAGGVVGTGDGV